MTTDIQRQLEEAWENAEQAQPQVGDTYIRRAVRDEISYEVGVAAQPILARDYRILERAKPKAPEWEAVVASHIEDPGHRREVYVRTPGKGDDWESPTYFADHDHLVDPVPLVELPSREALTDALEGPFVARGAWEWPGSIPLADAVLELLRGERR